MKKKYKGKIKVPFCIKYSDSIHGDLEALFSELLGWEKRIGGAFDYYGLRSDGVLDSEDDPTYFGENTTVYTLEKLQAVVDSVEEDIASEDSDGWIEWNGGEIPVSPKTLVEVRLVNGKKDSDPAECYDWEHNEDCHHIVAYRIIDTSEPSCSDDTATLATDEYVGIGEEDTGSAALVGNSVEIKVNLSFDVTIKGQTFTLTTDEIKELYLQLCNAEGVLKDWELG